MRWTRGLPAVALVAAVLWSCASVGRIEGGPYDETPPRFVRSTPEPGALNYNNEKRKRISIEFDEYIVLEGANEKVVISPPQIQQPEIKTFPTPYRTTTRATRSMALLSPSPRARR